MKPQKQTCFIFGNISYDGMAWCAVHMILNMSKDSLTAGRGVLG
jgi:hypothetical protein